MELLIISVARWSVTHALSYACRMYHFMVPVTFSISHGDILCFLSPLAPFSQRLSVQEVPPLLNGDSNRAQQQRSLPSTSQSDTSQTQGSPQTFRSQAATGGATGGASAGASPQHASTPLSASASPVTEGSASGSTSPGTSTPTTSGSSVQQSPLLLATNTSNLSPCLIPSTVLSLSQASPAQSSLQGLTLPISQSAPHSPPLPHSAPLSRAMTPVQLLHQQVGPGGSSTSSPSHNLLMKAAEVYTTATLPLPRRPGCEMRMGGFQGRLLCVSGLAFFSSCGMSFWGVIQALLAFRPLPCFLSPSSTSCLGSSLPRMLALSGPSRVEAMFAHTPAGSEGSVGGGACLLHFLPGDSITLLISEPRDGWHYGQNERTGRYISLTHCHNLILTQLRLCAPLRNAFLYWLLMIIWNQSPSQERLVPFLIHSAAPQ